MEDFLQPIQVAGVVNILYVMEIASTKPEVLKECQNICFGVCIRRKANVAL